MLTTKKSRLISLLVFILLLSTIICAMSVSVFAVDHDHDGDGVADHTDAEHKTEWEKFKIWCDTTPGQIWGFSIAGVLFVAIVVFIVLWIPKKTDKKEKKAVAKKQDK